MKTCRKDQSVTHSQSWEWTWSQASLWVHVNVMQSCPTLDDQMDCTVHRILQARIMEWVAFPFSRGSSLPRDWTQGSHIAGGFFTSWATREGQEDRVGRLSLLQQIFPTQELNWVLQHWRWTLYQLSYQGSSSSGLEVKPSWDKPKSAKLQQPTADS